SLIEPTISQTSKETNYQRGRAYVSTASKKGTREVEKNQELKLKIPKTSERKRRLMDKGKNLAKSKVVSKPNKIYMDLQDIMREHALRFLPAKSLHRFKAVCKDWKLQISTPFFEHSQSVDFRSTSGLFCQSPEGSISFISLDPMAYGIPDPELKCFPEPVDLLTSCHGLVCCRGRFGEKAYYICNPVNQHWKKLPKPEADHGQNPSVVLAFEPSLLSFVADYKLICAFPSSDFEGAYEFEIYSSVEDSWKISSEVCFGENRRILKAGGVHLNGVVYWLSNNFAIIGFDLKKNRVKVIPSYEMYGSLTLGIMDGKLCVASKKGSKITTRVLSNEYANTMHMQAGTKLWKKILTALIQPRTSDAVEVHVSDEILLAVGSDVIVFPGGRKSFLMIRGLKKLNR
ncbi:hypothetical protein RDABS01_004270, partial [Bienertia sinuspersici]